MGSKGCKKRTRAYNYRRVRKLIKGKELKLASGLGMRGTATVT